MFFVYILKSERDKKNYIGHTDNLKRRLQQHNSGKVRSTKHRIPLKLIYIGNFVSREKAIEEEKFFKTHKGYNYLKKIGIY